MSSFFLPQESDEGCGGDVRTFCGLVVQGSPGKPVYHGTLSADQKLKEDWICSICRHGIKYYIQSYYVPLIRNLISYGFSGFMLITLKVKYFGKCISQWIRQLCLRRFSNAETRSIKLGSGVANGVWILWKKGIWFDQGSWGPSLLEGVHDEQ